MHLYVIECEDRDELMNHLRKKGIGASLHYPLPVHRHKAYEGRARGKDELSKTNAFYKKHMTLPMFPELNNEAINRITSSLQDWFDQV
jgi:dTDP-4-amino-4,6-dideoxygalactose transaminase